jgi:hypothetical protein
MRVPTRPDLPPHPSPLWPAPLTSSKPCSLPCSDGLTALLHSASNGTHECARLLLEAFDPATQVIVLDKDQRNAVMLAASAGMGECVTLLLAACDGSLVATQCQAKDM